jgi:hypothetical protein
MSGGGRWFGFGGDQSGEADAMDMDTEDGGWRNQIIIHRTSSNGAEAKRIGLPPNLCSLPPKYRVLPPNICHVE